MADAGEAALKRDEATGFLFDHATPEALGRTGQRAIHAYRQPALWQQLMRRGMAQDFSWRPVARQYLGLYQGAIEAS